MSLFGFNTFTLQPQGAVSRGEQVSPKSLHLSTQMMHIAFPFWHRRLQFSSVVQLCPTLCNPMDCRTPGLPVHYQLLELAQTHVHQVGDAIQPSCPLSSPLLLPSIFPRIRIFPGCLCLPRKDLLSGRQTLNKCLPITGYLQD